MTENDGLNMYVPSSSVSLRNTVKETKPTNQKWGGGGQQGTTYLDSRGSLKETLSSSRNQEYHCGFLTLKFSGEETAYYLSLCH